MTSELRRAFEIGFLIFVPFLVIDMVVASVLMSMGMMMLPPVLGPPSRRPRADVLARVAAHRVAAVDRDDRAGDEG